MKPDDDDREPIEVLYDIESKLDRLLSDSADVSDDTDAPDRSGNPWQDLDISRGAYYALVAVSEHTDSPRSKDINERYCELNGIEDSTGEGETLKVSPRLTEAYQTGYVERTPHQPYRYWLTEKGEAALFD